MSWWGFKPYVNVAQKRANAARKIAKLQKKGQKLSPVTVEGNKIARTFWGKAWCDNLESYSDYENRLPRGRSYVRNGSVIDLRITPGTVTALVSGSSLYEVRIDTQAVAAKCWDCIKRDCSGQIGSMIELLQGKLSSGVMGVITRADGGLFPKPTEIKKSCSCPDWADMCKHVAAALYAVGARLDHEPELLFVLRQVDHLELITQAGDVRAITESSNNLKTIAGDRLADVFGIELAQPEEPKARRSPVAGAARAETPAKSRRRKDGKKTLPDSPEAKRRPSSKDRASRPDAKARVRPADAAPGKARRKQPR